MVGLIVESTWSAHVFVGNILGSVVAALFLVDGWGWSFVVPAIFIRYVIMETFNCLVTRGVIRIRND
jgi:hypothetical protein